MTNAERHLTRYWANRFRVEVEHLKVSTRPLAIDPILWQAQIEAMESMAETLEKELEGGGGPDPDHP